MKTLQELYNWYYLNPEDENSKFSNWKIPLRVAPLKIISKYKKLEVNYNHFAFAEKNKNWEIEYFHGLNNFLLVNNPKHPPIFIFDNHNHGPIFWYNTIQNKNIKNIELIHIDQHSDCRENKNQIKLDPQKDETEKVFKFCNEKCNVWNFIPPFIECWLISNQTQIRSITALQNLKIDKNQNFIIDIDLDFCLNWINKNQINKESIKLLKEKFNEIWKFALCITIATSPYFLNQEIAINIIEKLLS
jgi:hypothetical protein